MSPCLLIRDKIVNEEDTINVVSEKSVINFAIKVEPEMHTTKVKVSKIDVKSRSFHAFLVDLDCGISIGVSGSKDVSIVEKSEIDNPNIKFKHYGGRNDGQ